MVNEEIVQDRAPVLNTLQDFLETFDAEEGHDKTLREALVGLPDKPKKKRMVKARSNTALTNLLARLAIFEEFDANGDGMLSLDEGTGENVLST